MSLFHNFPIYKLISDQSSSVLSSAHSEKEVCVLCKPADLTTENKALLEKILSAIGHDLEGTNIISMEKTKFSDVTSILSYLRPKFLLSFEINLNTFGLNIDQKLYKALHLENTTIIISESLSTLQENKESKLKLWTTLKEQFK